MVRFTTVGMAVLAAFWAVSVVAKSTDIELALEEGDLVAAAAMARTALEKDPNGFLPNHALALSYETEEKYAEAIACLKKCLAAEPDKPMILNSLAMDYLLLGDLKTAEAYARKIQSHANIPCVKDTLRQIRMVRSEREHPEAAPVVSNILAAVDCAYRNNKEIGNAPMFLLRAVRRSEHKGMVCWNGSYLTAIPSDWRPYPAELHFRAYPSGRVVILWEDRKVRYPTVPRFSYYNLQRHFELEKPILEGVTSIEDPGSADVLLRFNAGEKVVQEIRIADLLRSGLKAFSKAIAQADRIVIRDGSVNWDRPTDGDPVLRTITDPLEIAAFNRLFGFVEQFAGETPQSDELGLGCRCPGGPGIDWWKGKVKLAQTGLHHGKALWWDGFAWDFILTPSAQNELAKWFDERKIHLSR